MAWRDVKKSIPPPQKVTPPKKISEATVVADTGHEPVHQKLPRTVSWDAPEFIYYEKTSDWYWALGIITLALFVIAVFGRNFLFGTFILLGAFTIILYASKRPRIIHIVATGAGVTIDDRLFPFEHLKSFWIFYRVGGIKELSLQSEKALVPYIKIPLGDANPNEIRDFLLQFLREKTQEESLIDIIVHRLRF